MIPKIIHWCWLSGDPYPPKIQACLDTWKKVLPDYEIILWDTNRFDVNSTPWTKQAFEVKKYPFVADYIRLYAIYNYGGIYLDSDVEVIKSFDEFLDLPYFAGIEANPGSVELAAFGAEKGTEWIKLMLDYYQDRNFILEDGTMDMVPMPTVMGELIRANYYWTLIKKPEEFDPDPSKICVLPVDWFCAHPIDAELGCRYYVTKNTHCIHHFANSWTSDEYPGGPLHKLYFKISGKNWKFRKKRFRLYGDGKHWKNHRQ